MKELAQFIDSIFNGGDTGADRKVGFTLLVFPLGVEEKGRMNYVSNADRRDMIVSLKELVANFEGRVQTTETPQ
jgi:hypothetical protein